MTLKTLAAAACLSICTATAGLATTVTVDGIGYDVTTITGTFSDNEALLMGQVWWGDYLLAYHFANAVDDDLDYPNSIHGFGPLFAYQDGGTGVISFLATPLFANGRRAQQDYIADFITATYAIATPVSAVPLPAGGLLLVSAFGGIAALKRRKKGSA